MSEVKECIAYPRNDVKDPSGQKAIFRCENGLIVLPPPDKPLFLKDIDMRHKYLVRYIEKPSLNGRSYGRLMSYEPIHDFEVQTASVTKKFEGNKLSISANIKRQCSVCSFEKEDISEITLEGDVIEIDGKPYFMPASETVLSPIPLENVDTKPSVRYVTTKSGLYVPIDFLSEDTMKKVRELDEKYASINCDKPRNLKEFEECRAKVNALKEQIEAVVEELKSKGFKFEQNEGEVEITAPDGTKSLFTAYKITKECCDRKINLIYDMAGRFALLGQMFVKHEFIENGKIFAKSIEKYAEINACLGAIDGNLARCSNGKTVIIADSSELLKGHSYLLRTMRLNDLELGISKEALHVFNVDGRVNAAIVKGTEVEYGVQSYVCDACSYKVVERAYYEEGDKVSLLKVIDGKDEEIYIVSNTGLDGYAELDYDEYTDVIDTPPVTYLKMGEEIYIPLGYISQETIEKIKNMYKTMSRKEAKKEASRLVIEELQRKGFKFQFEGDCDDEYRVTIEAPDGKSGSALIAWWHEDVGLCCELAFLAMTYCTYVKTNAKRDEYSTEYDEEDDEE